MEVEAAWRRDAPRAAQAAAAAACATAPSSKKQEVHTKYAYVARWLVASGVDVLRNQRGRAKRGAPRRRCGFGYHFTLLVVFILRNITKHGKTKCHCFPLDVWVWYVTLCGILWNECTLSNWQFGGPVVFSLANMKL